MYDNTKYGLSPDQLSVSFSPQYSSSLEFMDRQGRLLYLPCRHCIGCRLDHSREWANRVIMEQTYHSESWFVTLTYDDEHLPRAFPADPATGEVISVHASLRKSDLQKFFKRLRASGQQLRYYAAGEYGSTTYRPHYHCIIFGLHLDDLVLLRTNFSNQPYYTSNFISKLWPFGIHVVGRLTFESAAYVARYTMKKSSRGYTADYYRLAGIEPEFQVMSLKPAIARRFYDDHQDLFQYNTFSVATPTGGVLMTMPEYFRKLQRRDDPRAHVEHAHNAFVNAAVKRHLKLLFTDLNYSDILSIEEEKRLSKISSLTRDSI